MFDYEIDKDIVKVTLDNNNKVVKISKAWVDKTAETLDIEEYEAIAMWLEDNDYLENEEQEELDTIAKANKVKLNAESVDHEKRKPSTRAPKSNPEKENLISLLAETLKGVAANVEITNKSKMIEFTLGGNNYKLDLICKRPPKEKKEK